MAFTLITFLLTIFLLLSFVADFFAMMDGITIISDPALTMTLLDWALIVFLFYEIYDFLDWLAGRAKPRGHKTKK